MATSVPTVSRGAFDLSMKKERSLWGDAWRRLLRNRGAVFAIGIIVVFTLMALFAPLLAPYNPVVQTSNNSQRLPAWVHDSNPKRDGNSAYLLGTDAIGRDVLSQLIYGVRVSLLVGIVPVAITTIIGVLIGLVSGFAGGSIDNLLMRFTEIVYAFPDLLFVIIVTTAFRDTLFGQAFNGLLLIFFALSLTGWVGLARLVRGQVLSLKQKEFIEASRALGVPTWKVLLRHILPNTLAPIIVTIAFAIPGYAVAEAGLTFLGVGMRPSLDPNNPFPTSWGLMLQDGFSNINSNPWMLLFPATGVALLTVAFTFLGDGLRDALDPRNN
jgi:oligopeptide transport system permease protein